MTATLHTISASSAYTVPQTQNTAPVHEYRCLYTHDVRRKAKRWQDGVLRFHTFNKRVMVYDVQRNFVGDMHWQEGSGELQDGDELSLERSGALVQVGEQSCTVEQDLSGLLAKRTVKPVEKEPVSTARRGTNHLQPKSPNIPLGTPGGRLGRAALPQKSPFEARHKSAGSEGMEQGPASKRQRRDDNHIPLWELLKTSRPSRPGSSIAGNTPSRNVTSPSISRVAGPGSMSKTRPDGQTRLNVKETIDLVSSWDPDAEPSDTSPKGAPDCVAKQSKQPAKLIKQKLHDGTSTPAPKSMSRRSSKDFEAAPKSTEQSSKSHLTNPASKTPKNKQPLPPPPPSSPPVSTMSHLPITSNGGAENPQPVLHEESTLPETIAKRPMKALRLASRVTKKTLLCQNLVLPGPQDHAKHLPTAKPRRRPFDDSGDSESAVETMLKPVGVAKVTPVKKPSSKASKDVAVDHQGERTSPKETAVQERQSDKSTSKLALKEAKSVRNSPGSTLVTKDMPADLAQTNDGSPTELVVQEIVQETTTKPADLVAAPRTAPTVIKTRLQRLQRNASKGKSIAEAAAKHAPPDYSHLDAQLLTKPSAPKPTTSPAAHTITEPNPPDFPKSTKAPSKVPDASPPKRPAIPKPPAPAAQPSRPANPPFTALSISKPTKSTRVLTRHHSINGGTTSTTAPFQPPVPLQKRTTTGLQRAETLPTRNGRAGVQSGGKAVVGLAAAVDVDLPGDAERGPWSRESWDLLGWAPPGRALGVVVGEG